MPLRPDRYNHKSFCWTEKYVFSLPNIPVILRMIHRLQSGHRTGATNNIVFGNDEWNITTNLVCNEAPLGDAAATELITKYGRLVPGIGSQNPPPADPVRTAKVLDILPEVHEYSPARPLTWLEFFGLGANGTAWFSQLAANMVFRNQEFHDSIILDEVLMSDSGISKIELEYVETGNIFKIQDELRQRLKNPHRYARLTDEEEEASELETAAQAQISGEEEAPPATVKATRASVKRKAKDTDQEPVPTKRAKTRKEDDDTEVDWEDYSRKVDAAFKREACKLLSSKRAPNHTVRAIIREDNVPATVINEACFTQFTLPPAMHFFGAHDFRLVKGDFWDIPPVQQTLPRDPASKVQVVINSMMSKAHNNK